MECGKFGSDGTAGDEPESINLSTERRVFGFVAFQSAPTFRLIGSGAGGDGAATKAVW